jgi:hypothetical protein
MRRIARVKRAAADYSAVKLVSSTGVRFSVSMPM